MYYSPSIIRMIKSRRMRQAGNVARMRRRGLQIGFCGKTRRRETARKT
jgi:hypothetical protein